MNLTTFQKQHLAHIRKRFDDNEMFERPDWTIGKLLDIIDTLQQPETAPQQSASAFDPDEHYHWTGYDAETGGSWSEVKP